jgi:hypothetical protein
MAPRETLAQALVVAAELMGHELSPRAAEAMARELASYSPKAVGEALKRCMREVRGKLTLADVIARIDDGRPGPEQAWAMCPRGEEATAVMTDEMATAFGAARKLLETDEVAARMAFREIYTAEVQAARNVKRPVGWFVSQGTDRGARAPVIVEAAELGRITASYARLLLSDLDPSDPAMRRLAALDGGGPALPKGEPAPDGFAELTKRIGRLPS